MTGIWSACLIRIGGSGEGDEERVDGGDAEIIIGDGNERGMEGDVAETVMEGVRHE